MNGSKITIALALAALAGAQAQVPDSVAVKVDSLNSGLLRTEAIVGALSKLKVSGFAQFQYVYSTDTNISSSTTGGSSQSYSQKQGAWSLRRARLKFDYNAGNGSELVWQPDFIESKFQTKDAYFQYTEQWQKAGWVRGGIQDIPFGFEIGNSSAGMENIERSRYENKTVFNGEKGLGLVAGYTSSAFPLNAKIGWLNGQNQQSVLTDWSATQDPRNFVGRLGFATAAPDLGLAASGGVSYYFDEKILTDNTNGGSIREFRNDSFVTVTGRFRQDLNTGILGVDLQGNYAIPHVLGLKLLGEYYQGKIVGNSGSLNIYTGAAPGTILTTGGSGYNAIPDIRNTLGFYVSGIVNPVALLPQLQLVYRFDYFDPNTDVSGNGIVKAKGFSATDIAYTTNTIGVNWLVNGNLKVSLFYDFVNNETTNDPALDGWANGVAKTGLYTAKSDLSKNIDDDALTLRAQVMF